MPTKEFDQEKHLTELLNSREEELRVLDSENRQLKKEVEALTRNGRKV